MVLASHKDFGVQLSWKNHRIFSTINLGERNEFQVWNKRCVSHICAWVQQSAHLHCTRILGSLKTIDTHGGCKVHAEVLKRRKDKSGYWWKNSGIKFHLRKFNIENFLICSPDNLKKWNGGCGLQGHIDHVQQCCWELVEVSASAFALATERMPPVLT